MINIPTVDFTDEIPGTDFKSDFTQLSKKGDRIKFRIFAKPFYLAKHWITEKEVVNCPKTNNKDEKLTCEYCEKFENGIANPNHRSGTYKPNLQFYYPIIDRGTHQAAIFQTSVSVHMVIKEAADAGIDVYKSDWQVTRNEGSPANYYGVVRLDGVPVTDEEKKSAIELKPTIAKIQASLEAKESKMEPKATEDEFEATAEEDLNLDEVSKELEEEEAKQPAGKKAESVEDEDGLLEDLPL